MSKSNKPTQQQRREARIARHDAHIARMAAGHRPPTEAGRRAADHDRAHAARRDADANRVDPDR